MFLRKLLLLIIIMLPGALLAKEDVTNKSAQAALYILDYIRVDYAGAVADGKVLVASEYQEQQELTQHLLEVVKQLPETAQSNKIEADGNAIYDAVKQKASSEALAKLAQEMMLLIIANYPVQTSPKLLPDLKLGASMFQENCSRCHGVAGFGNGPLAKSLTTPPANFHDAKRQYQRNLLGLYNTITLGVSGTAMPSFAHFSDQQRWALAYYVGNFVFSDAQRKKGQPLKAVVPDLKTLTMAIPAQILASKGEQGIDSLAYLRANPARLAPTNTVGIALDHLQQSIALYKSGKFNQAYQSAVDAYLLGVEPIEPRLKANNPDLKVNIEDGMNHFRSMLRSKVPLNQIEQKASELKELLERAQMITRDASMSSYAGGFSAFIILLREGLEAILVIAAMAAFMVKTDRRHELHWMHAGWISAFLLGIATWAVATHWINFSAGNREMTEGIAALIAAVMLLYVGYWLHRQSQAKRWQEFIRSKLNQDDASGKTAILSIVAIAFLAVYREMFETILFLQTLWLQVGEQTHGIIGGASLAIVALAVCAWMIFKFSARLPLGPFFRANAILLFIMAIVFSGQGIYALQEAGFLPFTPFNFPRIELLGIYPNMQSLLVQAVLIFSGLGWLWYQRSQVTNNDRATE